MQAKEHETSQYFRIKVLELLYHATKLRKEDRVAATYYAREHIEIVKRVRKAMLKDLSAVLRWSNSYEVRQSVPLHSRPFSSKYMGVAICLFETITG